MDSDAFALLTGGVRFNKKRFAKDAVSLPAKSGKAPAAPPTSSSQAAGSSQAPPEQSLSKKKKRKRGQPAADADEGEDGHDACSGAQDEEQQQQEDDELDPGCPDVQSKDVNEADNAVRKHYKIKVSGYDPAPPLRSFQQLVSKLSAPTGLVRTLKEAGYDQPTPIQRQAMPILMAGRELLAVAPTGGCSTQLVCSRCDPKEWRESGYPTQGAAPVGGLPQQVKAVQQRPLVLYMPRMALAAALCLGTSKAWCAVVGPLTQALLCHGLLATGQLLAASLYCVTLLVSPCLRHPACVTLPASTCLSHAAYAIFPDVLAGQARARRWHSWCQSCAPYARCARQATGPRPSRLSCSALPTS